MNRSKLIDIPLTVIPCDSFNTSSKNLPAPPSPSNCFLSNVYLAIQSTPVEAILHVPRMRIAGPSRMRAFYPPGWRGIHGFFWLGIPGNLNICHWNPGRCFIPHPRVLCVQPGFLSRRDSWKQKNLKRARCHLDIPYISIIFANLAEKKTFRGNVQMENETASKKKVGYTFWPPGSLPKLTYGTCEGKLSFKKTMSQHHRLPSHHFSIINVKHQGCV